MTIIYMTLTNDFDLTPEDALLIGNSAAAEFIGMDTVILGAPARSAPRQEFSPVPATHYRFSEQASPISVSSVFLFQSELPRF